MEYTVIHNMFLAAEALIRAYCFYCLVKPFMTSGVISGDLCASESIRIFAAGKERSVFCVGAAFFLTMQFGSRRLHMDFFTVYVIDCLVMFFLICLTDRRNYRQKAFLVVVFSSLSWLSEAMAEILYDNLYAFAEKTDYMRSHPEKSVWTALYAGVSVFQLTLEFAFTAVGIRQILKVYRNKNADMGSKELLMLAIPSIMGVMAYEIIQSHRNVYILESGRYKDDYDVLIVLFYAVSVIAIIVVVVLYQDIKAKQEENRQAELLAVQIDSIRRHIEQVESLYRNIRGVRHDMTNHILTLERLYEGNRTEEAREYSKDLKAELAQMAGGIESGNPITDVILQEFKKEAEKRTITFHSEFHYPADSNINVFDISVILNNALQNAVDHTKEGEAKKRISIVSFRRNNACIIEICNSFTGCLQWDAESGLPVTSKERAQGHGYGLPNIRRAAEKYSGDIDITLKDGEFCLCIMLMTE